LERLRCANKTLRRIVNEYMNARNHRSCITPRTFFDSRLVRFFSKGNLFTSNQYVKYQTGTEYDVVENNGHEYLVVHREKGTLYKKFFVLGLYTPILLKNIKGETLVFTPEDDNGTNSVDISSPPAPLVGFDIRGLVSTSGHTLDSLALTFLGKIYNRSCDSNSNETLRYVRSSYWVSELRTVVCFAEKLPWIVIEKEDGSFIRAHLPCPKDLPRSRAGILYDDQKGILFVIGGRGSNNRRTSGIFTLCLKEYVKDIVSNYHSTNDLYLDTECFLYKLKENLLEKDTTSFDEDYMFLPQHPNYILLLSYMFEGLVPTNFRQKKLWKYHPQELSHPRSDCLVKTVNPYSNLFMVCGGTSTHKTRLGLVEFFEYNDDEVVKAFPHTSNYLFCPDV